MQGAPWVGQQDINLNTGLTLSKGTPLRDRSAYVSTLSGSPGHRVEKGHRVLSRLRQRTSLFRSSIVVTGAHYSITTLLGAILDASPAYHMVHEPANPEGTLSFQTIGTSDWYEYFDEASYFDLREALIGILHSDQLGRETMRRIAQVRGPRDAGRIVRFLQRQLPRRLSPRPGIFKAPFLAFSARTLQAMDGLRVVIGVRHPAAWIESVVRRDGGYDVSCLLQPALLDAVPEFADDLRRAAGRTLSPLQEALLLWKVIHTHHHRYLLGNDRTAVFRQEDLVRNLQEECRRLFAFAGVEVPATLGEVLTRTMGGSAVDFRPGGFDDYLARDGEAVLAKWRTRVSAEELALIRRETEGLAAMFGYGPQDWGDPAGVAAQFNGNRLSA